MAWTYIVECADGSFYVGSTTDLERRISEHNLGLADFERVEDAYLYEKRIQGWSRAKRVALIDGRLSDLSDLASRPPRGTGG